MDGLGNSIPDGSLVGIDTSPFIYQLEASPKYFAIVDPFFRDLARGRFRAVTSTITLMEVAVRPLQLQRPEVADDYELLLINYPHLRVVDVDRDVARRAAELRARYRLRPADSLHLATALSVGATYFITNDRTRSTVGEIRILLVDNFVSS